MTKTIRGLICALAALMVGLAAFAGPGVGAARAAPARTPQEVGDEWAFVDRVNTARTQSGRASLAVPPSLREHARDHSERMATAGYLFHDGDDINSDANSVSRCWSKVGENVGVGTSVDQVHQAFMASAGHRANILDGFDYVGVGVEHRNSRIWVTQRFMKLVANYPRLATEPRPATPPPASLRPISDVNADGRTDLVWQDTSGVFHTLISDGQYFRGVATTGGYNGQDWAGMGDVDGDGRSDLIFVHSSGIHTLFSDGARFGRAKHTGGYRSPKWVGPGGRPYTSGWGWPY